MSPVIFFISTSRLFELPSKVWVIPNEVQGNLARVWNYILDNAPEENIITIDDDIKHWKDYDYVLVNENLEICYKQIENIIFNNKNFKIKPFQKF